MASAESSSNARRLSVPARAAKSPARDARRTRGPGRRGSHAADRPPRERKNASGTLTAAWEGGARCHRAPSPEPRTREPGVCARRGAPARSLRSSFLNPGWVSAGEAEARGEPGVGWGEGCRLRRSRERTRQRGPQREPVAVARLLAVAPRVSWRREQQRTQAPAQPAPRRPCPARRRRHHRGRSRLLQRRWPPLQPAPGSSARAPPPACPRPGAPEAGASGPPARRAGCGARGWGAAAPAEQQGWDARPRDRAVSLPGSRRTSGRAPLGSGRRPPHSGPLLCAGRRARIAGAGGRWHYPGSQSRGGEERGAEGLTRLPSRGGLASKDGSRPVFSSRPSSVCCPPPRLRAPPSMKGGRRSEGGQPETRECLFPVP